jgi:hypothetical protein
VLQSSVQGGHAGGITFHERAIDPDHHAQEGIEVEKETGAAEGDLRRLCSGRNERGSNDGPRPSSSFRKKDQTTDFVHYLDA